MVAFSGVGGFEVFAGSEHGMIDFQKVGWLTVYRSCGAIQGVLVFYAVKLEILSCH